MRGRSADTAGRVTGVHLDQNSLAPLDVIATGVITKGVAALPGTWVHEPGIL